MRCLRVLGNELRARKGRTFEDVEAARSWLAEHEECTGKIGSSAFASAADSPCCSHPVTGFSASGVNYGVGVPKDYYSAAFLASACPIVGSYGATDRANPGNC